MNILYILGNGFDKAQGMKTSYPEFYQYLMKKECSTLLEQMKKGIKEDTKLWSDMEEALGNYTEKIRSVEEMDSLHAELSDCLQEYLLQEDANYIPSVELKNKIKSDILHPERYLAETDRVLFNGFVKSIPNSSKESERTEYHVITLNYTSTFEKLFQVPSILRERPMTELQDICHVHGELGDTIIIGVDNTDQIKNVLLRRSDEIASFFVKVDANAAMKNLRHNNCEQLIKKANLIVLFGVSFGETDMRWWKLIGEELIKRKDVGVISFLYCPGEIPDTRKYKLIAVEKRERERIYSKMNLYSPSFAKEVNDRFFIVINSLMFNKS